jgi:glucosylceramidase
MLSLWISSTPEKRWQKQSCAVGRARETNLQLTGARHQTWEGCGGCFNELGWLALSVLGAAQRQRVIKELFDPRDGCRFNLCRLPIGASDYAAEWYSLNETDGDLAMKHFSIARDRRILIPYIKAALKLKPDLKLFASPWSPPTWMKFPKAYNYGNMIGKKEILDAYALYFVKFVQAYKAEGIPIHQIHPQNEPVANQKFPSCVWKGGQMRDFIRDHLAPAFRKHGLGTEIWLGTINSDDYHAWADTVLSDETARAHIAGVAYQWAGKHAVQRTRESWPRLRLLQSENECGDGRNTWEYAEYVFDLMRHYISNGVVGYVYWNMVLAPKGQSTWGWEQNAMITVDPKTKRVTLNPEFYLMKHTSRFVAPGAVRLGLQGQWAANAFAFRNPNGETVLVAHNPFGETQTLSFEGSGEKFGVSLAARSFNTLVLSGR